MGPLKPILLILEVQDFRVTGTVVPAETLSDEEEGKIKRKTKSDRIDQRDREVIEAETHFLLLVCLPCAAQL